MSGRKSGMSVPSYAAQYYNSSNLSEREGLLSNNAGNSGSANSTGSAYNSRLMSGAGKAQHREQSKNRSGIAVALFITFLASVCFSIVLPSIWPFLSSIYTSHDEKPDKSMVGWAVSVNSIGSFVASPLFGWWMDKRTTREVLGCSLVLMIGGNVMYSLSTSIWVLLLARFIVGVASANYAVAQAYLSYATTMENRTAIMALNSAANVLGFVIGPAFALITTKIPQFKIEEVPITKYTSPGYISAFMSLVGLLALIFLREIPAEERGDDNGKTGTNPNDPADDPNLPYLGHAHHASLRNASRTSGQGGAIRVPKSSSASFTYGMHVGPAGAGGGSVKSFAQMFRLIQHEASARGDESSVGPAVAQGSIQSFNSGVAAGVINSGTKGPSEALPLISKNGETSVEKPHVSRKTVIAVVVCLFAYFSYTTSFTVFETVGTQYTETDKYLRWDVFENSLLYAGLGIVCIVALFLLQVIIGVFKFTDRVLVCGATVFCTGGYCLLLEFGDSYKYVSEARFLSSLIIAGAGYATATAVLFALYSKVLDGLDQGMMMGWLSSAGSVARIVGPLFASYVMNPSSKNKNNQGDPFAVFASVVALLTLTFLLLVVFWKQLAPVLSEEEDDVEEDEEESGTDEV